MIEPILKSRFLGALVGTALGDALGAGFEGRYQVKPEEIEEVARARKILVYTDDTHMMIGVAESLIRAGGFDGEDMADTFLHNYELEPYRGYGPGPPYIFRLIRAGVPWNEAAQQIYPGGSYGNGSAMRIAPIGVFYHHNPPLLREVAYQSSRITHTHNLGQEGAALQAYAIALATSLQPPSALNQGAFLTGLTDFTQDEVYRRKLESMRKLLTQPDKSRVAAELGNGIEAFNSVPAAIFSFLVEPDSFARAVLYAINLGGDTDTIGAMTGAISGAHLGIQAIPDRWKDKLDNRPYIEGLAEQLHALYAKPAS